MKNKLLVQRLKNYSILAGSVAGAANVANSQVQYTDVSPDVTINTDGSTYGINLDGDAVIDFVARVFVDTSSSSYAAALMQIPSGATGNVIAGSQSTFGTFSYNIVSALSFGTAIDNSWTFVNSSLDYPVLAMYGSFNSSSFGVGSWHSSTNDYVGVQFDIGGNTHYGWIRMDVTVDPGSAEITIKDFAYNATPNTPINAGDMGSAAAIPESLKGKVNFIQKENQLLVNVSTDNLSNGTLRVIDITGKEVQNSGLTVGTNSINLDGLSQAVYLVAIEFDEGVFTEKVFVR